MNTIFNSKKMVNSGISWPKTGLIFTYNIIIFKKIAEPVIINASEKSPKQLKILIPL